MADAVIRAQQVQPAPAGYTVPQAQEIIVKSVRALVDGSGAGSSFLAVLQLIAPDDSVVWEAPTDSTIAAGGSANVSWFPRVGAGAATGGGPEWFFADRQTNYTMLAATSDTVQFTRFETSNSSLFALAPDGVRPDRKVSVAKAGVLFHSVFLNPAVVASYPLGVLCNEDNGTQLGIAQGNPMNTLNTETLPGASHGNPGMVRMSVPTSVPWAVYPTYDNFDGVNHTLATISYGGVWWPNSTLFV